MKDAHTLPAVHALHLVELVKRWGVEPAALIGDLGTSEDALADPDARLPVEDFARLVVRARALTGEPALGIHVGMQMRISVMGYLGFAALSASTAREALELAARFSPTRTEAFELRIVVDGDSASIVVDERADFGDARDTVLTALLIGIWQIGCALTGRELTGTAEFAFPEPAYAKSFGAMANVRFGQPVNRLVFDRSVLDLPLVMSDPAATRLAREQL